MNDRIKELAVQIYGSAATAQEIKFAELIIQECADLFPLTFTDEHYQRRIYKTIRKHFGLEQ